MTVQIIIGDAREKLREMADCSVQCCVTSPPYYGLRDYGVDGQMGLEETPNEFVAGMVGLFREVRRVLRDDGTLWLNLGDSYAGSRGAPHGSGLKAKDLIGIPWRVAFALRADGWYLRQDIIWSKPNPMPESVRDRCTKAHEYIFLLSKGPRYFYDADAIKNAPSQALIEQVEQGYGGTDIKAYAAGRAQSASGTKRRIIDGARKKIARRRGHDRAHVGFVERWDGMTRAEQVALGSNKRSVWEVGTQPFSEAHFATFPPALIEPCILAGSPAGGMVLDPFGGAGTTGLVSERLGRDSTLIELNPEYADIARRRIRADLGRVESAMPDSHDDAGPLFDGKAA